MDIVVGSYHGKSPAFARARSLYAQLDARADEMAAMNASRRATATRSGMRFWLRDAR
jgi:hypothetical protein